MHSQSQRATLVLITSSSLWGLSWIPLKYLAKTNAEGLVLIFVCYLTLFLVMVPFTIKKLNLIKNKLLPMLGIFLCGGLANLCFTYALIHGDVVRVMVLFYLLPAWGVLGGQFILKEKTDGWRWLGVLLAVVGAFVLLGGKNLIDQPPKWIDLIAILSGFFLVANNMFFRAVENLPLTMKISALFFGCFFLAGVLILFGIETRSINMSWPGVAGCVAYALFWLIWANIGSQWAITRMPAGRSSIIIITELVVAVISAILIGGEHLTVNTIIGGALILTATAMEIFRSEGEKEEKEEVLKITT